jgi:hypothetical protein
MNYQTATELAQIGNHSDLQTGAVSAPIYFLIQRWDKAPDMTILGLKILREQF